MAPYAPSVPRHLWHSDMAMCMCCRERQDQLERAWWEEKAELSAGPAEQGAGGRFSDTKQEPESGHTSWQVANNASFCVRLGMARALCHVWLSSSSPRVQCTVSESGHMPNEGYMGQGKKVVQSMCKQALHRQLTRCC